MFKLHTWMKEKENRENRKQKMSELRTIIFRVTLNVIYVVLNNQKGQTLRE